MTLILHTLLEEWDSPSHSQDQSIYGAFSIRGKFLFILNYNFKYFSNFHPFPGSDAGLTYHSFQNSLLGVSKGNAYYVSFCFLVHLCGIFTLVKYISFLLTSLAACLDAVILGCQGPFLNSKPRTEHNNNEWKEYGLFLCWVNIKIILC